MSDLNNARTCCGITFGSRRAAKKHRDAHQGNYPCMLCSKTFSRRDKMKQHERTCNRKRPAGNGLPLQVKKMKLTTPPTSSEFNIRMIHRGMEGLFKVYRAQFKRVWKDFAMMTTLLAAHLIYLIERAVLDTDGVKAQLRCTAVFKKEEKKDGEPRQKEETWHFNSSQMIHLHSTKSEEEYAIAMAQIHKKIENFTSSGSGWVLKRIEHVDLYLSKYSPVRGSTYIPLPRSLAAKKAIINPKNNDDHCFMWSVLAKIYHDENGACKNPDRISRYRYLENRLNFTGINFPTPVTDIPRFEEQNGLSVNVFGYSGGLHALYISKNKNQNPINLLLLTPEGKPAHYCWIKDLDKLLFQSTKYKGRKHVCPYCLCCFNNEKRLQKHEEYCTVDKQRVEIPADPTLKFRNVNRQIRVPYVMYADFECFIQKTDDGKQRHVPNSYGLLGVRQCCGEAKYEDPVVYRGDEPVKHFLDTVLRKGEAFQREPTVKINMSPDEFQDFQNAQSCHICEQPLQTAVKDHCHRCGKCVAKGVEDYVSFKVGLQTNGRRWNLKFVDSLAFLNASLETLTKTLPENQFNALNRFSKYPNLMRRKGIYPYDFMDSEEKFRQWLPDPNKFYNKLKLEQVSTADYEYAKKIWDINGMQNMGNYHDLYLLTDVLLLTDVFQGFRDFSVKHYKLDPAHYITLPSFAWDALLKMTRVELELLTDPDMYHFFTAGIRGGVTSVNHRHAKANNPFVSNYDPRLPMSYILYLDFKNLYGWGMERDLPFRGFEWVESPLKLPDPEPGIGYVWEVDLEYPEEKHDEHNNYPFAPEKIEVPELSPYCQQLKEKLELKDTPVDKLIPNLWNKERYIIHHRNLEQCLAHGLQIGKIHRGIRFEERAWMVPYIRFNTEMRANAADNFQKDLFKLLNNAVFGKSMENVFKCLDFRLVADPMKYEKLVASPLYQESHAFSEDLTGVMMRKEKAVLNRPIYTGFSILELSKTLMYRFHYDIDCVAKGVEDYVSFKVGLQTNGRRWNLKFVDSLAFLNASLETLTKTLPENQFNALNRFSKYPNLMRRKGIYPYDFMDSEEKFRQWLPDPNKFYNKLKLEQVSTADYEYAKKIWDINGMQNMGNYHDLYLLTDVLLLTDVFQGFRDFSVKHYKLDPAHYITLPSFAWDALLKMTRVELELLTDPDMYHFFTAGIRGGVTSVNHRHAKANNPFVSNYDPRLPMSYILYLDFKNLYGWGMERDLPFRGFEWVEAPLKLPDPEPGIGYVWEVDLEYPEEKHDEHNNYPFAPEKIEVPELSPYCQQLKEKLELKDTPVDKLIPNLWNKERYIIHHRNLEQCLAHGLQIGKIHRGIRFEERAWMVPYIRFNTEMRANAADNFQKDLFKLLNNAVLGKSMENVFKYLDFRLVADPMKYEKLVASPLYQESHAFSEDLTGVMMRKEKAVLNRPIYTGFSILELSKTLMYRFHYDYIQQKFEKTKLLFTDTDSFCYYIESDKVYEKILEERDEWFDTSNYPSNHFLFSETNKTNIGYMKDEKPGEMIEEVAALRAKMYSIKTADDEHKRAKGISRAVVQKRINHEDFVNTLTEETSLRHDMVTFQSRSHEIYTVNTNKSSLSAFDDKRFILDDGVTTLAYGHKGIPQIMSDRMND